MVEHGYVCHFENDTCKIFDNGGAIKLWQTLRWRKIETFHSLCTMPKMLTWRSWLWHKRMKHLIFRSLKYLQPNVIVHGSSMIQEAKLTSVWMLRSSELTPEVFSKDKACRTKAPLEVVHTNHTDVCVHTDTVTHADNK